MSTPTLQAAQQAIKRGHKHEARELLQQAIRQNPNEYRAWLWLAGLAPSPRASLGYIAQAEAIRPNDPTIAKARAWAESRLETTPAPTLVAKQPQRELPPHQATNEPTAVEHVTQNIAPVQASQTAVHAKPKQRKNQRRLIWAIMGGAMLVITLLVAGIFKIILDNPTGSALAANSVLFQTASTQKGVENSLMAVDSEATAVAIEPNLSIDNPTAVVEAMAVSTATPIPINPKSVAAVDNSETTAPRATWTPTPRPTNTPTPTVTPSPTPTYAPTIVSASAQAAVPRPAGVGLSERWIDVNLTTQTLTAYEGNQAVRSTLISSGLSRTPTVTGQFRIYLRYPKQDMDGYRLGFNYYLRDVPYVQYFYGNYGLHGTFWHNNFGTPMSHGCVNLPTPEAEWLYNWASIGTLVYVHY